MRGLLRRLFRRPSIDDDIREEIESHLAMRAESNRASGLPPDEALHAARRQFGSRARVHEETRALYIPWFIETIGQDVRYGVRTLTRNPGFALTAVVTLALGIGATAAIFQALDTVVLKPLSVRDPHGLVRIQGYHDDRGNGFSYPLLREMTARQTTVEGIFTSAVVIAEAMAIDGRDPADQVAVWVATGNYFRAIGTEPWRGRLFADADDEPSAEPVAVISYAFWRRELGSRSDAIGRTVHVNGVTATIVGITRPEFGGERIGTPVDVWLPLSFADRLSGPSSVTASAIWLQPMARLRADVPLAQAEAELSLLWDQLKELSIQFRGVTRYHAALIPAPQGLGALHTQFSRSLWLLMGIVAVLALLTSCNLANLLLARAVARTREIGVRLAIGARRRRLVRQLVTESLVLCTVAGGLGLLLAAAGSRLLVALASAGEAWRLPLALDWRVAAFTALLSLCMAAIVGLAPALTATSADVTAALQGNGRRNAGDRRRHPVSQSFVVAQVALSFLLVAAACLLGRSFWNLTHQDFGFEPDGVLMAELDTQRGSPVWTRSAEALHQRLGEIPGVVSAAVTSSGILGQWSPVGVTALATADRIVPADAGARIVPVSPGYVETMRIPIFRGRSIAEGDHRDALRVAVINETAGRLLFGSLDAVGRSFAAGSEFPSSSMFEVVGVMGDHVFAAPQQPIGALVFAPLAQWPAGGPPRAFLRVASDRVPLDTSLETAVQDILPGYTVSRVRPLADLVRLAARREHMLAWLSATFGGLALVLAVVGLYGVTAYSAKRRKHEIGIRMALGARPAEIRRAILKDSFVAVAAGLSIGLTATLVATRALDSVLFGLSRNDPATLLAAACVLFAVAMLAAYQPAERAARSDPLESIRQE